MSKTQFTVVRVLQDPLTRQVNVTIKNLSTGQEETRALDGALGVKFMDGWKPTLWTTFLRQFRTYPEVKI